MNSSITLEWLPAENWLVESQVRASKMDMGLHTSPLGPAQPDCHLLMSSPPTHPFPHSVAATQASSLVHKHTRHMPASGLLQRLFLLPGMLFP